ncbi:MAG: hypothetical protein ACFCUH_08580 [Flavobacteriales bacterium]
MENKEFDKFIRDAAKEAHEVPAFLDWGNMNIPIKKKRRGVPFWFFVVFIGLMGAASVWWAVGYGDKTSSVGLKKSPAAEQEDASAEGIGRGKTTVPVHMRRAFYGWLNGDCIDAPKSVAEGETAVASTPVQDMAADQGSTISTTSAPSTSGSITLSQVAANRSEKVTGASGAHPPVGEKNPSKSKVDAAKSTDVPITAQNAGRTPAVMTASGQMNTGEVLQTIQDEKERSLPHENLALLVARSWTTPPPQPIELMGQVVPLPSLSPGSLRSLYISAGVNTYRNRGSATEFSSDAFGLASMGQSFSFGWIQPAKRMFNVSLGLSYSGLNHYYEGMQDLGFENDFAAGQRIRRQRVVRHNNRIHLLQLDAGAHTAFRLGARWDAFVWVRLSPGWKLRSSGRLLLDNLDDVVVLEDAVAPRDLVVSASVSAGVNYWLTERSALIIRQSYTRYLTAFGLSNTIDAAILPEVIDLSVGVQYRLSR